jgi:hypothetical protein
MCASDFVQVAPSEVQSEKAVISPVFGSKPPPITVEHQPPVPEHALSAVAPILPSAPTIRAVPFDQCEHEPAPWLSHPVPTTKVGGTGLPSLSLSAG